MQNYINNPYLQVRKTERSPQHQGFEELFRSKRESMLRYEQDDSHRTMYMLRQYQLARKENNELTPHLRGVGVGNMGSYGYLLIRLSSGQEYRLTSDIFYDMSKNSALYVKKSGDSLQEISNVVSRQPNLTAGEKQDILHILNYRKK